MFTVPINLPKPFFKTLSKNDNSHKLYAPPVNFVHSVYRVKKFNLSTVWEKKSEGQIQVVLKLCLPWPPDLTKRSQFNTDYEI